MYGLLTFDNIVVRVQTLHLLARDKREAAEIQAGDVESEGPSSGDLYVIHRLTSVRSPVFDLSSVSYTTAEQLHVADQIDKSTLEVAQADDEVYTNIQELADELPGHSPRFVLLSYPLTLVQRPVVLSHHVHMLTVFKASGRLSVPYVLIYYLPVTCNAELRMLYASAKELMRNTAEAGRVIEMQDVEDLETIEEKLGGEQ